MGNFLWKQLELTGTGGMWRMAWFVVSCVHLMPADFLGHSRGLYSIQHISHPALGHLFFPLCSFASDVRLSDIINLGSQRLSSICFLESWWLPNSFLYFVRNSLSPPPSDICSSQSLGQAGAVCSPAPHAGGCLANAGLVLRVRFRPLFLLVTEPCCLRELFLKAGTLGKF